METLWTTSPTSLLLATTRVMGVMVVAPAFGSVAMPRKLRAAMAMVLGLSLSAGLAVETPTSVWSLAGAAGIELALGATMGYALRLVLVGAQMGAWHVGQQMGLSLAESYGAAGASEGSALQRLTWVLAVGAFFAVDGHRELVGSLRESFVFIPAGGFAPGADVLTMAVAILTGALVLALKVAGPMLVAGLLVLAALGILQRTAPSMNTFTVGLPARAIVGLFVLASAVMAMRGAMLWAWEESFEQFRSWLSAV